MKQSEFIADPIASPVAAPVSPHPTPVAQPRTPQPLGRRAWGWTLARVVLVALLAFAIYKVARMGLYGAVVYQASRVILAQVEDGALRAAELDIVAQELGQVNGAVQGIERELVIFTAPLRAAEALPAIGPTLAALPDLLQAGGEMAGLAHALLRMAVAQLETQPELAKEPVAKDAAVQSNEPPAIARLELLVTSLAQQPEGVAALQRRLGAAQAALTAIPVAKLLPFLVAPVTQGQAGMELLQAGLELAPVLPVLLGFDQPRTYLLLVQNNQELRATGGFISAVVEITVERGRPTQLEFHDSYAISRDDVNHPWAPEPLRQYMGIELIFLRDANWSPDFPTSAQLARSLYAQDVGVQVDGVISIDLRAVELLIGALGALEVAGADEPITGANIVAQMQQFWDKPIGSEDTITTAGDEWLLQRKDFMPVLAQAALTRLEQGDFNPLALAGAVKSALDERAIQVWLVNPIAAAPLAARGWDGALRPQATADYLALVDTNMGYNKVDAIVTRAVDYQVSWPDGANAPALATATITYRHPLTDVNVSVCKAESEYGLTYTDMMKRCYFDYVRLYVPEGSQLVRVEGVAAESVSSQRGDSGTHVLAGYFALPPGQEQTVRFTYRLPAYFTPANYRLVVQRQSGAGPLPLTVTMDAPVDASMDARTISALIRNGRWEWRPVP